MKNEMMINTWIRGLFKRSTVSNTACCPKPWVLDEERYSFSALCENFEIRSHGEYDRAFDSLGKKDPRLLNWIGSISWSGYTREKCLRYLVENYTAGDENRILLRLSDWVMQVQTVAEKWALAHFDELPWEAIKNNDRLFVYLSRKERLVDRPVLNHMMNVILAKSKEEGQKAFFDLNSLLRRLLYSVSLAGDQSLRDWMIKDSDPFNRLLLLSPAYRDDLSAAESALLGNDNSVFIRRKYLQMLLDQGRAPEQNYLICYALDRNQGLRETARFYLDKFYSIDTYELYKQQDGVAAYYISDFAKLEDVDFFIQGMQNADRKIRLLCLKAIARIDPLLFKQFDAENLIIENRHARRVILPYLSQLYALNELLGMRDVLERSSPNGKYLFFNLIGKKSFWVLVNTVLADLIDSPSDQSFSYVQKAVMGEVNIYESLPDELAHEIRNKIQPLKSMDEKRYSALIKWIAFSTRVIER